MLHAVGYRTGFLGKYLNGYPFASGNPVPPGWDDFEAYEGATEYYNYKVNRNGTLVDIRLKRVPTTPPTCGPAARATSSAPPPPPSRSSSKSRTTRRTSASSGTAIPAPRDVGACARRDASRCPRASTRTTRSASRRGSRRSRHGSDGHDRGPATRRRARPCGRSTTASPSLIDQLAFARPPLEHLRRADVGQRLRLRRAQPRGQGRPLRGVDPRAAHRARARESCPGTIDRLTSNVDLVPTFLAWAKTSAPAGLRRRRVVGRQRAGRDQRRHVSRRGAAPRLPLEQGNRPTRRAAGTTGLAMGMNWGLRTARTSTSSTPTDTCSSSTS